MARPQKSRKICNPPKMKGFKPFGMPLCKIEKITLKYEEFESIKLVDYDMLSQDEAAEHMEISRPTFTRIYNKAIKTSTMMINNPTNKISIIPPELGAAAGAAPAAGAAAPAAGAAGAALAASI